MPRVAAPRPLDDVVLEQHEVPPAGGRVERVVVRDQPGVLGMSAMSAASSSMIGV
jgi:hypothetical protein